MAEVQIKKMGITHEMILNWLMLNPEKTQNECAEYFDVTPAWLSVIINSDCFQARWAHRRQMMDQGAVRMAEAKMRSVIDKGLERLEKMVETVPDPEFVLNTTDKMLGRLGYGPKSAPGIVVNTQNNYAVSREVLAQARDSILNSQVAPALEMLVSENSAEAATEAEPGEMLTQRSGVDSRAEPVQISHEGADAVASSGEGGEAGPAPLPEPLGPAFRPRRRAEPEQKLIVPLPPLPRPVGVKL